jgi:hypothetical protein
VPWKVSFGDLSWLTIQIYRAVDSFHVFSGDRTLISQTLKKLIEKAERMDKTTLNVKYQPVQTLLPDGFAFKKNSLDAMIDSIKKRLNNGDITPDQAMEKMQAVIMASKTIGDLELTHNAFDSLQEPGVRDS